MTDRGRDPAGLGPNGQDAAELGTNGQDPAERIRRRFQEHDPSAGHDTGGTPWAGRQLTSTGFDGDTGEAAPELLAALAAHSATAASTGSAPHDPTSADTEAAFDADAHLVSLVARARLLVPVVAVAGETVEVDGLVSDASSDMAAVTLVAPDGHRALPAFSSLQTLADWDASARPVPVTASRAAQAAVQEGCHEIVLDVGAPTSATLRGSMVWALAMDRPWLPPHRDPQVRAGVEAAVAEEPSVLGVDLAGGPQGALRIELRLRPGLGPEDLQQLARRIGERIALDGEVRARIDALAFSVAAG
ncbi:SseB family protein [Ornithinimicrobium sp. F0845]|uniref:SseB family protein n=1 Tax=Ornithinimicrobium sp. F0845 TaxID=2926412 RepID=UPI001FF3DBC1|nr:SseB family protein [Ornithinimicrobium sp. F0845]MCK0114079.1 SseB family protein [Ornithinimicrobium sp. F0845]